MFPPLAYYSASGLLNFVTSLTISLLVLVKRSSAKPNRIFSMFSALVAFWSLFYFLSLNTKDARLAEFYFRTCMIGVVFMPSTFVHFVLTFLRRNVAPLFHVANYAISILLAATIYTPLFALGMRPHLVFPYWGIPGLIFPLHLLHFGANVIYAHFLMFQEIRRSAGVTRNQILYVFVGTGIGFIAGSTNYFAWYRIPIPPVLNPFISLYVLAIAYAIVRYRLMDINLAITRTAVFAAVYILVLGLPLAGALVWQHQLEQLLGDRWWAWLWIVGALLTTVAHYANLYFRRRAEERLLREQRRYQTMLLNSAKGMTQIHNLQRLLKLLAYLLVRAMKLTHASVFLWDENREQHVLQIQVRPSCKATTPPLELGTHEPLVLWLMQERAPVVREEISQLDTKRGRTVSLSRLETRLKNLDAAVVVPSFVNDRLIGFLALGNKRTGTMYSEDDLSMLQTLANQAALAIENAQFYEKERERQAELFHAASIADLGTMASSMSHQLNNPLCIISGTAQNREEYLRRALKQDAWSADQIRQLLQAEIESLQSIQQEATDGSNIIATIRGITASTEAARPLLLAEAVNVALPIAQHKVPFNRLDFRRELPDILPRIWGDKAQLAQCMVSFLENAWDAIQARQEDRHLPAPPLGYKGLIRLAGSTVTEPNPQTKQLAPWVVLTISDNGIGLKPEDLRKLFIPFFTTKATAEKAFGSLFVVRRIIEAHGGTVSADSTYGVGTTFNVRLPALSDEEAARRMTAGRIAGNGPVRPK